MAARAAGQQEATGGEEETEPGDLAVGPGSRLQGALPRRLKAMLSPWQVEQ